MELSYVFSSQLPTYISQIMLNSCNICSLFAGAHAGDFEAAHARIITPSAPEERGAQLSIQFNVPVASLLKELQKRGVAVR